MSESSTRGFNKPSKTLALEQIYAATGFKVPSAKITLGTPVVLDQRLDISDDENTFVPAVLETNYDARFSANGGFRYRRLSLSVLNASGIAYGEPVMYPTTVHAILPLLNLLLQAQLSEEDVHDDLVVNDQVALTLRAKDHSLMWLEVKHLTGGLQVEPIPISGDIALTGFVYVGGTAGLSSLAW